MALFFADSEGNITYKTDQLEANFQKRGSVKQQVTGLSAVSFQDMNADGLWDIVLISECEKESAAKGSAEKETENTAENIVGNDRNYRVGDVLFQGKKCFYRDWRVSDKVNRFGMNKSIKVIAAYVRDGYSTEFMYTAATMDELLQNGLHVVSEQCYWRTFEKLGRLMVVPGTYRIADYEVFMIYLVNEQGNIVWSCQPMEDYDSLYALKGINCRDIDGDGLKDLVVLARYSKEWNGSGVSTQTDYAVYYQRVSGFTEDKEIKEQYICREDETMTELVRAARAYWGWSTEDD
ncbi:MAG: VCBS repeat-containing protein [Clostridiales bacterium]|nr:VCBS repeat-containing protein [Clostridiales bacterium]